MKLIKNARIFDGSKIIDNYNVLISGTKIEKLIQGNNIIAPDDTEVFNADGRLISPGFIDIHIHGTNRYDVMDGTEEAIENISLTIAKHGTTSFLPTTLTMPIESLRRSISAIKNCIGKRKGANILGIHLEGPFINEKRKGAQNEKYIMAPNIENYESIVGEDQQLVKRITLAPEIDDGIETIKYIKDRDVCVSIGHTCASIEEFNKSVCAGASLCTHLFNGMDPLHHRDPGVVGGALLCDKVYVEFIPDLIHVNKDILKLIIRCKGEDKCILITDSMSASCLGDGLYTLGEKEVVVSNGIAKLNNGSLAGSIIMMDTAVKNMVNGVGIDIEKVLKMATINPAKVIGVDNHKGRIKEGFDADLIILNKNLDIEMTMIMGEVYS
jgi:N-acetylglucosamine-6-phosphate deacetylase